MNTFLCLATLVVLATAYPTAVEDPYKKYVSEPSDRVPEYDEGAASFVAGYRGFNVLAAVKKGDSVCDRRTLHAEDVISQKFYDDHICLLRKGPPEDLSAFCRDFRRGQPIYQVMLLTVHDIKQLRSDLQKHQNDFYNDRESFRPVLNGPSEVHYTTQGTYTFIYCQKNKNRWIGKQKKGRYMQYIPKGPGGNQEGKYQIYHGCPPVTTYPGFKQPGYC